ncbi:hypothetical protein RF11_03907 [Thelohanellus kitauei]|uniref:Secreted protein n=1 Tax=Thelohanellus kitauei TaxID=669202 RepID=A0A0C2J1X0_THEKT|nr:hypothetical protein RF11_03907 [Thelohanellus kitauei]
MNKLICRLAAIFAFRLSAHTAYKYCIKISLCYNITALFIPGIQRNNFFSDTKQNICLANILLVFATNASVGPKRTVVDENNSRPYHMNEAIEMQRLFLHLKIHHDQFQL